MAKQSKRFRALAGQVPATKDPMPLATAVEKLKKFGNTKFDQTVEIHMRLGVDAKQADQIIRGSVVLPHGIGRTQRVAVFAKGDMAEAAKTAGADTVGQEDLAQKIKDGWTEFDVCIAAPGLPRALTAALEYHGRWRVDARPDAGAGGCPIWVKAGTLANPPLPPPGWTTVALERRPTDRDEITGVFRR